MTPERAHDWSGPERLWAALVTSGVLAAALLPLRQYRSPRAERVDGFPMSYYPMFSAVREQYGTVAYAVAVHADGTRDPLPHHVLGPGGVNQVRKQLSRAVRRGREERYAQLIAERVPGSPECAHVVRVEIVRGRFDLDACLLTGRVHGEETLLAAAAVARGGASNVTAA